MTPVNIIRLPHNRCMALYRGEVDDDGEALPYREPKYLTLPIRMPQSVMLTTSGEDINTILAIDVLGEDGGRIRPEDIATVWEGIQQYNSDCYAQGEDC
jgi:hypothetical protein